MNVANVAPRRTAAKAGQRLALALMLLAIALPLPLTLLVHHGPKAWQDRLASAKLLDSAPPPGRPEPTLESWWTAKYQRAFEPWYASVVEPRGTIVQLTNEAYYWAFKRSYMYNRSIVIGRDRVLNELAYVKSHCEPPQVDVTTHLRPLVSKVRELQHLLAVRERPLVFVITPSKAAQMPEFLPYGPCARPKSGPTDVRVLTELLRDSQIPVFDGTELVREAKSRDPLPPFPPGGVHWSTLVGARAAGRLMQELARVSGSDFGTLNLGTPRWDASPRPNDADLALLLNLRHPPNRYRVGAAELDCRSTPIGRATQLIAVGGSFLGVVFTPLSKCGLFKEIAEYFYYTQYRFQWPSALAHVDRKQVNWRAIFEQPTVLIVELNESLIHKQAPHLHEFLDDALSALR